MSSLTRRKVIYSMAVVVATAVLGVCKKITRAIPQQIPPADISLHKRLGEVLRGRTPVPGKIHLKIPAIVEDGSVVPVTIQFGELLSAPEQTEQIALVVDNNPDPLILTIRPKAHIETDFLFTRIRMRKSSRVAVYASTGGGRVYMDQAQVQVTSGGCE